jgi:MFS family permease
MALITLPVMATELARVLQVPAALIGVYVAIVYACAMVASLSAGAAVARFGAIRMSQVALVSCAAGLVLCTIPSVWAVAIGAMLIGLGYGPVTPASSHLLAKTTPAHRMSLVFSIKQTGVPVGGVLAGALVPSLLLLGWQGALLVVAAANIACIFVAQPLRAALDADREPSRALVLGSLAQPLKLVLRHPALRMLAGCSFMFSIAQLSLTTYLVTYLHTTLGYGLVAAGLALSVSQFAGVVGRIVWGYVADRWLGASRTLTVLAAMMSLTALATAFLQTSMPALLVLVILSLFGASAIGWNGVYLAQVAREAPAGQASIATGGTLAFTFFGVVVGPPLFGALVGATGSYRVGFSAVALVAAACVALLLLAMRRAASQGHLQVAK